MPPTPLTLVDYLQEKGHQFPDRQAYVFLHNGETEDTILTYGELDRQARAIGALLQRHRAAGERVVLLYPPGVEFIAAFLGCLYANAIAVPAYPPRNRRHLPRIQTIVEDAQVRFLLTVEKTLSKVQAWLDQRSSLASIQLLVTDNLTPGLAERWQPPQIVPENIAFLQYTSGSTATPKGVMVSHENLIHNLQMMAKYCEFTPDIRAVIWLPPYHDMGLIGGLLETLLVGFPVYLMSPTAFLQRPLRWLQAISDYKATTSGGPNFAYDLCVSKIPPEQRESLDLSSWNFVFNGAEPIHYETLMNFATAFAPCGFRKEAFYPSYGLAEATLFVTGGPLAEPPIAGRFLAEEIEQHHVCKASEQDEKAQIIVGCGQVLPEQHVEIVDPDTCTQCAPDHIGEIWISGPSVTQGYWNQPDTTHEAFQAYLVDTKAGPFLRTGDLGFVKDGILFVTGRLKDLIIIRGRNYYPQDIEWTVEHSDAAIRRNSSAAFSITVAGEERLVIVAEVERRYRHSSQKPKRTLESNEELRQAEDSEQIDLESGFSPDIDHPPAIKEYILQIRESIATHHGIQVYGIVLIKATTIPRTSSGKIRRRACRIGFLSETLDIVGEWIEDPITAITSAESDITETIKEKSSPLPSQPLPLYTPPSSSPSSEVIQEWLVNKIAYRLGLQPHEIDIREPFARYGLDSVQAVSLSSELEDWLGYNLSPTLMYEYPNIAVLSRYLAVNTQFSGIATQLRDFQKTDIETIAVIGLSCRFPGADTPEKFWQLLRNGTDAIREVPRNRWDIEAYYDPTPATPGKMNTRWGGFLDQIDMFDLQFFGISPREAENMDPQQRLLLEVAWEALESAGQVPDLLAGSYTGVFVGISGHDYSRLQTAQTASAYSGTGNALSIAANRLSYFLNLRGPSLAIDTACSSSLVAVHQACVGLRRKEYDMALAGGVNLILSPETTIALSQSRLMAADGRCKTFDARADGYVRGEGAGIIVLKRLSDALRDGDNILALIRGSAVNQDGRSNGLTAPNGFAQQAVIYQALEAAGISPAQISYFEAHGTGTALGDPIEVNALKEVLISGRSPEHPCWIGSVKTNIGHLESAAGIAGVIKVILALQHKEIPPHLHLTELNPNISLDDTPFSIPTQRKAWIVGKDRRLAGISSFGFGGTNAHVVIEETLARAKMPSELERSTHILTLSARTPNALQELAQRYQTYFSTHPQVSLGDICFTANTGRSHFDQRLAVVADSHEEFCDRLGLYISQQSASGVVSGYKENKGRARIAFLCTGQGAQYVNMGRQLYETHPVFQQTIEHCDAILRSYLEKPLPDVLYPSPDNQDAQLINQTTYTQPVLFTLEYALATLWMSWGVKPEIVLGHSVGEYVAACLAGVFSLDDALKLLSHRARLMQALPQDGAMSVVFANKEVVAQAIEPYYREVSIAAINGPRNTVISGNQGAVTQLTTAFQHQQIKVTPLTVSHAFHSPLMEPMLEKFAHIAAEITYSRPNLILVSNVTGDIINDDVATPEYWVNHIRQPVQFAKGVQMLVEQGYHVYIELGPHPTLIGMGQQCVDHPEKYTWLPSLRRKQPDWQQLLQSLGKLYIQGVPMNWEMFDREYPRRRVMLPTYPFQRQRYWIYDSGQPQIKEENTHTTPVLQAIQQGDWEKLAKNLEETAMFTEDELACLPKVIKTLIRRHHRQQFIEDVDNWLYTTTWQIQPYQTIVEPPSALEQTSGSWVVFADNNGLGQALAEYLRNYNQNCVLAYQGDSFQQLSDDAWQLDPSAPESFDQLFQTLDGYGLPYRGILHTWSLDTKFSEEFTVAALEQSQISGCGSALHLIQTLTKLQNPATLAKAWFITRGAVPITEEASQLAVNQAPLWGFGRVVALEHPELWGGIIDLDAHVSVSDAETILKEVLNSEGEDQVGFRGEHRYVARLGRNKLPETHPVAIHSDATYLITGGLGGLGLKVARWLVDKGARHLALIGRRGVTQSTQQQVVKHLEESGATVFIAQADVADEVEVNTVFEHLKSSLPPLKGVVHAAGVTAYQTIDEVDLTTLQNVLRPKVQGTFVLFRQVMNMPLDFFINFSSIASVWGSKGQCHYAAANRFLDSFVHYQRSKNVAASSINWGPWSGGGMVSEDAEASLLKVGINMLPSEKALMVLDALLGGHNAQITVADISWPQFQEMYELRGKQSFLNLVREESQISLAQKTDLQPKMRQQVTSAPEDEREDMLRAYLQEELGKILGLPPSDLPEIGMGFFDLGLDSLMAIDLKSQLERDLGLSLSPTLAFDYPTIKDLARYLASYLSEDIPLEEKDVAQDADSAIQESSGDESEPGDVNEETSIEKELEQLEALLKDSESEEEA